MATWTYQCYVDGKVQCIWQSWYAATPEAQGPHDAVFDIIEQAESWREPHTKTFDDIVEIIFKAGGRQWRVFGFYGKGVKQRFVIVGFGYHKGKNYTPKDILKTCAKRRKEIEDDSSKARDCSRPEPSEIPEKGLP